MTPESHKPLWKRFRRVVALGAATVAAVAVSGVAAGAAQAQSLELEFDEVYANIGASFQNSELVGPGDPPVTMSGDINLATGDFVIPPDGVFFPARTFTDAPLPTIDTTVSWEMDQPVTGNYDTATGDLSASFVADIVIDLSSGGNPVARCVMSDVTLPLETTGTLPGPPDRDAAPFAPPTREGAVVNLWDDLPPAEGASPLCAQVTGAVGGPGGIWMSGTAGIGFHVEFNRVVRQLGVQAPVDITDNENPVVFDGDFDPDTGEVTIPPEGAVFPPIHLTEPFDITIETEAEGVTTGTFDPETGELDLDMVVTSTTQAFGAICAFEGFEWHLSTSNTEPFAGYPFVDGLAGEGAISAGWADLPPVTPIDEQVPGTCQAVRAQGQGPGGILYERTLGPPPAANLAISVKPKRKAVKQGRKRVFRATVRNTGNAPATGVRVCINAPKKLKVVGGKCRQVGQLADGTSALRKFTVKAKRRTKPRAYRLRFRATSPDAAAAVTRATLRVKKR